MMKTFTAVSLAVIVLSCLMQISIAQDLTTASTDVPTTAAAVPVRQQGILDETTTTKRSEPAITTTIREQTQTTTIKVKPDGQLSTNTGTKSTAIQQKLSSTTKLASVVDKTLPSFTTLSPIGSSDKQNMTHLTQISGDGTKSWPSMDLVKQMFYTEMKWMKNNMTDEELKNNISNFLDTPDRKTAFCSALFNNNRSCPSLAWVEKLFKNGLQCYSDWDSTKTMNLTKVLTDTRAQIFQKSDTELKALVSDIIKTQMTTDRFCMWLFSHEFSLAPSFSLTMKMKEYGLKCRCRSSACDSQSIKEMMKYKSMEIMKTMMPEKFEATKNMSSMPENLTLVVKTAEKLWTDSSGKYGPLAMMMITHLPMDMLKTVTVNSTNHPAICKSLFADGGPCPPTWWVDRLYRAGLKCDQEEWTENSTTEFNRTLAEMKVNRTMLYQKTDAELKDMISAFSQRKKDSFCMWFADPKDKYNDMNETFSQLGRMRSLGLTCRCMPGMCNGMHGMGSSVGGVFSGLGNMSRNSMDKYDKLSGMSTKILAKGELARYLMSLPPDELKPIIKMMSQKNRTQVCDDLFNRTICPRNPVSLHRLFDAGLNCYNMTWNSSAMDMDMSKTIPNRDEYFKKTDEELKTEFLEFKTAQWKADKFCMWLHKVNISLSLEKRISTLGLRCRCKGIPRPATDFLKEDGLTESAFVKLPVDEIKAKLGSLTEAESAEWCKFALNETRSNEESLKIFEAGVNCDYTYIGSNFSASIMDRPAIKQAILEGKRRQFGDDMSRWSGEEVVNTVKLTGISANLTSRLNNDVALKLVKEVSMKEMDEDVKRSLWAKVTAAEGSPSKWTKEKVQELLPNLGELPPKIAYQLNADALKANRSILKDIEITDPAVRLSLGNKICSRNEMSQLPAEDLKICAKFRTYDRRALKSITPAAFDEMLPDLVKEFKSERDGLAVVEGVKNIDDYKKPADLQKDGIAKLGPLLKVMGKGFIDQLSDSAFSEAFSDLQTREKWASIKSDTGTDRAIVKKLIRAGAVDPTKITSDQLKQIGGLSSGFEPNDWKKVTPAALNDLDTFKAIAEKRISKASFKVILDKVASVGADGIKKLRACGVNAQHLTPDNLEQVANNIDFTCGSSTTDINFELTVPGAAVLFEMIAKKNGENMAASCGKTWKNVDVLKGVNEEVMNKIPDNELLDWAELIDEKEEKEINEASLRALSRRIVSNLTADDATIQSLKEVDMEQAGKLFRFSSKELLEKMGSLNKNIMPTLCRKLGVQQTCEILPRADIQRLAKLCMKYVLNNGAVVDRSAATILGDADVAHLGCLKCGLSKAEVEKMDSAALVDNLDDFSECVTLDEETEQSVVDQAQTKISDIVTNSPNLISMGPLIERLSDANKVKIVEDDLAAACTDISKKIENRRLVGQRRKLRGYTDLTESMEVQEQEKLQKLGMRCFDAMQKSAAKRRRRATTETECTTVKAMGTAGVLGLTTEKITAFSTSQFKDCAEWLGSVSDWNATQKSSLAAEAKAAYGAVSNWTAETIRTVGSIAGGLTVDEISTLNLSNDESVASIGQHDVFDSAQRTAAFKQWLKLVHNDNAAGVTADQLIQLGHFACGATNDHISKFSTDAYKNSAHKIGALTSCEETQLIAYAAHAKKVYGDTPKNWTTSAITTIGSVIGGLSQDEIPTLTSTQLSVITPTTLTTIPPSKFKAFTSTQLQQFTPTQANSVTAEQQSTLSAEQKSALTAAGAPDKTQTTDKTDNSGTMTMSSIVMVLACILMTKYGQ